MIIDNIIQCGFLFPFSNWYMQCRLLSPTCRLPSRPSASVRSVDLRSSRLRCYRNVVHKTMSLIFSGSFQQRWNSFRRIPPETFGIRLRPTDRLL